MKNKINNIFSILLKNYGQQYWWPIFNDKKGVFEYKTGTPKDDKERFEICIGAILTQNTSWKNVEQAIKNLKDNNLLTKEAIKKINIKKLESLIRCSGYYKQKAKKIKEFVKFLDSKKEITRENLLNVWGIGPETADSILLYAYNQPYFVIDAYTKRIFSRINNSKEPSYEELQFLFHKSIKKDYKLYNEYHALLVKHAKKYCKTKSICPKCPLNTFCSKSKDL